MKILHIGAYCSHGGVETILATLIREQKRAGIEVEAFYFIDLGGAENYDGLCRVRFAEHHSLTTMLMNERFDLIHVVADASASVQRCVKRALYQGAIVVTCHGAFSGSLGSDWVTAVSNFTAEKIKSKCPKPVRVIYNGIDTASFYPSENQSHEKPVIGWIGRSNDPFKDVAGLTALANSGITSDFIIAVVDGSHTESSIGAWLPQGSEVINKKPWIEMPCFYRDIAASGGFLLSTSKLEACPLNILEAQACGCPVIAPRVGGIPEIVRHQVTGYLYNRDNGLRSIKEAIDWLYAGDHYALAVKTAPEHIKQNFSAHSMHQSYLEIYEAAIKTNQPKLMRKAAQRFFYLGAAAMQALTRKGGEKK